MKKVIYCIEQLNEKYYPGGSDETTVYCFENEEIRDKVFKNSLLSAQSHSKPEDFEFSDQSFKHYYKDYSISYTKTEQTLISDENLLI